PFQGETAAVLHSVSEETPQPIRAINPDIPDWLVAIINKLHARKPEDRFASAAEVADLLGQHRAHGQQPSQVPMPPDVRKSVASRPSARRRPPRWLFATAMLALVLAVAGYLYGGALFRVVTDQGEFEVQTEDSNIALL